MQKNIVAHDLCDEDDNENDASVVEFKSINP